MGDIHLDAAEVVHHFHQCLHVHADVVVHGQAVLVVDHISQRGDAAAVGQSHRVDLVVGGGVGLAVGQGDLSVLSGHQTVAGDLQHVQRPVLDVELAVKNHVRHAVVGAGIAVVAAFLVVDAADQDVHHIALVLLGGLDLFLNGGGAVVRAEAVLHLVQHAHTVHYDARHHGDHRHDHRKRQPERSFFLFLAAAGRFNLPGRLCRMARRRAASAAGRAACRRSAGCSGRSGSRARGGLCGLIRPVQRAVCVNAAWRLTHVSRLLQLSRCCRKTQFSAKTCHTS